MGMTVAIFHSVGKGARKKVRLTRLTRKEMELGWRCLNIVGVIWSGLGAEFFVQVRMVYNTSASEIG